jgi:hypothetical protein
MTITVQTWAEALRLIEGGYRFVGLSHFRDVTSYTLQLRTALGGHSLTALSGR